MWEKQELSLGSVNEVPTFRVEYFKDNEVFSTQADKKAEARTKLLSLNSPKWTKDAGNMAFIARYCLDETFIPSTTKDSTMCYVDDSFLITATNGQIYINGETDGPYWGHVFQYASIVSDIPCIVTTTTENHKAAMHLFYGNDRYNIPNCRHISISPEGAVWWIDVRGKEFHTTLHDLAHGTSITEENKELPDDLVVTAISTTSDRSKIVFGFQLSGWKKNRKLFKDGVLMNIWELASIKELGTYSFEGDVLYLKYTDLSNQLQEIKIHLVSEVKNDLAADIQKRIQEKFDRIFKKMEQKYWELSATNERQQNEIKKLKGQVSALRQEMDELKDTNNRLSEENTGLRWIISDTIKSLTTALKGHAIWNQQLIHTAKRLIREHTDREKTNQPPVS